MPDVNLPAPSSPSQPASSPFDPALAESGRIPTLAVLWGIYALTTVPFLAGLLRGQDAHLGRNVLYATGTALLLAWVWRGSVWAWRLTVSLCMIAGLTVFVGGMLAGGSSWVGWVVSLAGIGYLLLGTALLSVPGIRAFLDSRWGVQGKA